MRAYMEACVGTCVYTGAHMWSMCAGARVHGADIALGVMRGGYIASVRPVRARSAWMRACVDLRQRGLRVCVHPGPQTGSTCGGTGLHGGGLASVSAGTCLVRANAGGRRSV